MDRKGADVSIGSSCRCACANGRAREHRANTAARFETLIFGGAVLSDGIRNNMQAVVDVLS